MCHRFLYVEIRRWTKTICHLESGCVTAVQSLLERYQLSALRLIIFIFEKILLFSYGIDFFQWSRAHQESIPFVEPFPLQLSKVIEDLWRYCYSIQVY